MRYKFRCQVQSFVVSLKIFIVITPLWIFYDLLNVIRRLYLPHFDSSCIVMCYLYIIYVYIIVGVYLRDPRVGCSYRPLIYIYILLTG